MRRKKQNSRRDSPTFLNRSLPANDLACICGHVVLQFRKVSALAAAAGDDVYRTGRRRQEERKGG